MKSYNLAFAVFLTFGFAVNSLAGDGLKDDEKHSLYITVKNIKSAKGAIMVAVYDNKKDYMKNPVYDHRATVDAEGKLKMQLEMPFGNYAITIFHDVDDDGKLDSNFVGIPKEPYGFSNNATGSFGPPGFDDTLMEFKDEDQQIEINLN